MALKAGYHGIKNIKSSQIMTRSEQEILGAKNLLSNNAASATSNGITFTVNTDGSVKLDTGAGSASANTSLYLNTNVPLTKGISYILSGGDNTNHDMIIELRGFSGNSDVKSLAAARSGKEVIITPDYSGYDSIRCRIWVRNATKISNQVLYPMIRLASDPEDNYVPYAMTNRDLTLSAQDQKTTINAIITAATGAADFAAFKTAMGAITPVSRSAQAPAENSRTVDDPELTEDEPIVKKTTKKTTKKTEEV